MPFKTAAKKYGVPVMSLKRRSKGKNVKAKENIKALGGFEAVFNAEQENLLVQHIPELECGTYGITTKDLMRLAYDLATINSISNKISKTKKCDGLHCLSGSQNRHLHISLRSPKSTSAARAIKHLID